ncbi:MAG: hypothetical protein IPP46_06175 [Bacteroidetes bacterium]|nr:hypothetical protein [Bacteroidota bacterium]
MLYKHTAFRVGGLDVACNPGLHPGLLLLNAFSVLHERKSIPLDMTYIPSPGVTPVEGLQRSQ